MDLLSISQEQAVLELINRTMGQNIAPELKYVNIASQQDSSSQTESLVQVEITGKVTTSDGQPGRWSGSKTLKVRRARFRQGTTPIKLRLPWKSAMAIEHVLRGLAQYHSFVVSVKELEFKVNGSNIYARLPESYRLNPGLLACRFHRDNIRYDPIGSEFDIELYHDPRPNVGVVVARADTGNINTVSED